MRHRNLVLFASFWFILVAGVALNAGLSTRTAGVALAAIGLIPPVLVFLLWREPPQTIAQIIHAAEKQS